MLQWSLNRNDNVNVETARRRLLHYAGERLAEAHCLSPNELMKSLVLFP